MSFKTMLAIVTSTDSAADLRSVVDMALYQGAHLSVIVAGLAVPAMVGDVPAAAWLDRRDEDLKVLDGIQKQATTSSEANGLSFDVAVIYVEAMFMTEEIHRRALYADILVVGDGVRGDRILTARIVDGGVFDARRPLLLVPRGGKATLRPRRVLLAWNSRTEAARAAREALDMMVQAEEVHVVLIDPDSSYRVSGGEPGADVAAYLARHGIRVVVEQLASSGRSVEEILSKRALEINADLVVMGAYGHARLRERIFGGVTASVLAGVAVPVLLAR